MVLGAPSYPEYAEYVLLALLRYCVKRPKSAGVNESLVVILCRAANSAESSPPRAARELSNSSSKASGCGAETSVLLSR